ncbi:hypothetical protein TorRG33x02_336170 [Trema orientale]|uniref:Uncharacterized protein n=1 Tax=Trema orientale TaxID=63057 RepID=A0A2P5B0C7_TREOI|nr:hypothetical protein TorRG33x02_336170 [Trema orientale]
MLFAKCERSLQATKEEAQQRNNVKKRISQFETMIGAKIIALEAQLKTIMDYFKIGISASS